MNAGIAGHDKGLAVSTVLSFDEGGRMKDVLVKKQLLGVKDFDNAGV